MSKPYDAVRLSTNKQKKSYWTFRLKNYSSKYNTMTRADNPIIFKERESLQTLSSAQMRLKSVD